MPYIYLIYYISTSGPAIERIYSIAYVAHLVTCLQSQQHQTLSCGLCGVEPWFPHKSMSNQHCYALWLKFTLALPFVINYRWGLTIDWSEKKRIEKLQSINRSIGSVRAFSVCHLVKKRFSSFSVKKKKMLESLSVFCACLRGGPSACSVMYLAVYVSISLPVYLFASVCLSRSHLTRLSAAGRL